MLLHMALDLFVNYGCDREAEERGRELESNTVVSHMARVHETIDATFKK